MHFYNFSDDKLAEYKRRIGRIKEKHPDTHYPSEKPRTLLNYAMYLRLDKDAINMAAILGDTKLCKYIYNGNPEVIDGKYSENGNTPLMSAVQRKRLGTAEWLLHRGAKILPNKEGWNPVLWACHKGCIPALNMFKHYGVDFTQPFHRWEWKKGLPRKHLYYPIEIAVLSNQAGAVHWLFNNGVTVNDKMEKGYSVRQMFSAKPEYFTREIQQILTEKILEESKKTVEETTQNIKNTQPQKTFWQRFSFGKTRV